MKNDKLDRRSKRTRQLLGSALIELMLEKRYDAITVQDILDRADVGRSTFYAHYTDKEDLLMTEIMSMIRFFEAHTAQTAHGSSAPLPSLALFQHVKEQRRLMQAFTWGHSGETIIHAQDFQKRISKIIEQRLNMLVGEHVTISVPLPIIARFIASTFLMLLHWWFENDMRQSPEEMDEMFQKLVMPSIHGLLKFSSLENSTYIT